MIKCEGGKVILDGEWKQIMTEYLCLSKKIIECSDKIYSGGFNPVSYTHLVVLNDRYKQYRFKFCRRTNTGL